MQKLKLVLKWILAVFFILAGINHFRMPEFYVRMVPPYLPSHAFLVSISGICETVLGLLLFFPRYQRLAGWGLILLLVAVFPANLQMALRPETFPEMSPTGLWIRLPFQIVFIAWTYWCTRTERRFT